MEHRIQHILVDTDSHLVSRYGEDIKLTRTEWLLLCHATNGGSLLISSRLNITDFLITLQADGFCPDFNVPEIIAAQRFAALLWMPMQMTNSSGKMKVEFRVPLKRL